MSEEQAKYQLKKTESVVKSFFHGNILEENIFPYPKVAADEAETLQMIVESIDRFMEDKGEEFRRQDEEANMPEEYLQSIKELGLFGLIIPEDFGGIGLSNSGYSRVAQQVARYDGSTTVTLGAHSSIGMKGLLLYGTDAQKEKYLPKLATGEFVASFCLTEPGAGSDAASIKTHAVKNEDGSWVLNGEKLWISNASFADFFTVFARTESGEKGKISAFILERSYEGISIGPKENKMGIRSSATTAVHFDNVKIPAENLLGEEGKGFKIAMNILNNGRTGLGGGCIGSMKSCIKWAVAHAAERNQFGQAIANFSLVKEKISNMTVDCFAAESVIGMIGHYIDSDVEDYSTEAAISKVFCSEALWRCSNEALQIAGGTGYMKEYPYERAVRDARINLIFEGTNEILRLFIALSGMKNLGQELKSVEKAASNVLNDPIKGFGLMSKYATKKFSQLTSLGRERMELHEALRKDAAIFEEGAQELGRVAENALKKYGKKILGKQFVSKRLADVSIDLFVGCCMLSRINSMLAEKSAADCKHELSIMKIFRQQAKRRMKNVFRSVEKSEDSNLDSLADFMVEQQGYKWDTI